MALSQLQCLDDNHVNLRTNETKPEFQYCEDQRLGLETLLAHGREAFAKFLEQRGMKGFLSDLEQETLAGDMEHFDPDLELYPEGADENEPPLSLDYWPELSDQTVPQMDLGWPDCESYRGVSRTAVFTQPPQEGQAPIKEAIRKMIAQAQKVIAVVMDLFTDVDIFKDLLDISFKKKVSVYILVERKMLPHFLSMCHRADMHAGHLKNLRVRCTGGREFFTRTCTKVCGRLGHRFMIIDGDKAASGSYSFTWTSARLERNLITVVTGQSVDTFDRLFQCLYMTSSYVDIKEAATKPEPAPEPVQQRAPAPPPSAAIARKLYNPKYALVMGNFNPSATPAANQNRVQEESKKKTSSQKSETKKEKLKRARELEVELPPLHPGLVNLEKVRLVEYLPTWPEPDPSSDVIGFINIVDNSRSSQVHLQRSERFGVSQAIKFSSPISDPKGKSSEAKKQNCQREIPESAKGITPAGEVAEQKEALNDVTSAKPKLPETNCESAKETKTEVNTKNQPAQSPSNTVGSPPASSSLSQTRSKEDSTNSETDPRSVPTERELKMVHPEILKTDAILTTNDTTQSHPGPKDSQLLGTRNSPSTKSVSRKPSTAPSPNVTPPIPKPRTVHHVVKENTSNQSLEKQSTNTIMDQETKEENDPARNDSSTVPDAGWRDTGRPKSNNHAGNLEKDLTHNGVKETQVCSSKKPITSELSKTNTDTHNILDSIQNVDPKTSVSVTKALTPQTKQVTNIKSNVIADQLLSKMPIESATQLKKCQAKASDAQVIPCTGQNSNPINSPQTVDLSQRTNSPASVKCNRPSVTDTTLGCDEDTQRIVAHITSENHEKLVPGRPQELPLTRTQSPDPSSSMPERPQYTFRRISTPDGGPSRTSTPDSRTTTPDSAPHTPGFRTPTTSSDGYVSSIEDSTLSTTSDEYYECNDSLFNEWFFDRNMHRGHSAKDDQMSPSGSSPVYMNCTQMPEKQEKMVGGEKVMDETDRKKSSEGTSTSIENDGNVSPKVPQRQPQLPKKKKLPMNMPDKRLVDGETKTRLSPAGRKKYSADWQVLKPNSDEKTKRVDELEETDGKKEERRMEASDPRPLQNPRPQAVSHLLTPRPYGSPPKGNAMEMMFFRNSTRSPPARPPPPQAEGSRRHEDLHYAQNPPPSSAAQNVTRVKELQEKPSSHVPFLPVNLQQEPSRNEERKQNEGWSPFSISLSKLHKITGLKAKKSSPAEGRKGTG